MRLMLVALVALAAGCSSTEQPAASAKVAAKVNGTAIALAAGTTAGSFPRDSLERVIDRELLVQQALSKGLEKDPEVQRKVEEARRQVLAQAYLEHVALDGSASAGAGRPSSDVARFYAENPALFAKRRVYRFQEMIVAAPADKLDLVKAELSGARDLEEVAGWLKWRNLKVSPVASVTMPAEQLPLSHLPQLVRMKEGEIAVLASPMGASVIQLVHAQEAPLSPEQAAPVIEQFLAGRKRLELAAAEVRRLRETASIEYVGEFKR